MSSIVDDAHGIGVLNNGKGVACVPGVDLIAGVFSKAFGSAGGFVAGDQKVIEYLRLFGRAQANTTNISVANAACALATLKVIQSEPDRVERLAANVRKLRGILLDAGIWTADTTSPIIALICGKDANAYWAWKEMFDAGVLVHALPFPVVPRNKARIRIRVNTFMDNTAIEQIAEAAVHVSKRYTPKTIKQSGQYQTYAQQGFTSSKVDTEYGPVAVHQRGNGRGDGEPWVFLHPLLWGSEVYAEVFRQSTVQAHLIAIDFWGHGQAQPLNTTKITLEQVAITLEEVLFQIGLTDQSVNLVGTSFGAMVGLRYATEHSTCIKHLILIGGSADSEDKPARRLFLSLADISTSLGTESTLDDVMTISFSTAFQQAHPITMRHFRQILRAKEINEVRALIESVVTRQSIVDRLPMITCPTTVIVGDADLAEPIGHSERLAEEIPLSRLQILSGCGHLVPVERPLEICHLLFENNVGREHESKRQES